MIGLRNMNHGEPTEPAVATLPASASAHAVATGRRRHLLAAAGVTAAAAWFGMAGLVGGWLSLGATVTTRLPFDSPALAGVALGVAVAAPPTVLASVAWHGDRRTERLAIGVGAMLIGWIVLQVLIIQAFSWFQPMCVAFGAGFVLAGSRRRYPSP